MEIEQQFIKEMNSIYLPTYRCLISADYEYPEIRGKFRFDKPPYTNVRVDYLTIFDTQLATIQMGYMLFAQAILEGRLPEFSLNDFKQLQKDLRLDIHRFDVKFKRKVELGREIGGKLRTDRVRRVRNIYVANMSYDFEECSTVGNLESVVVLNNLSEAKA